MKLIDKELNIWSCTLGELTYRQICILKAGLGEDSVLAGFESFFDDKTGQIIMNEEHDDFILNMQIYSKYLGSTDTEKDIYIETNIKMMTII